MYTHILRHICIPLLVNSGKTFIKHMLHANANCAKTAWVLGALGGRSFWGGHLLRKDQTIGRKGTTRGTKVLPGNWVAARW